MPQLAGMRTSVNPSTRSNDFKGTEELVTPKASPTPSANTIFTEDAAAKAREILRRKLRNLRKKTPDLEFNGAAMGEHQGCHASRQGVGVEASSPLCPNSGRLGITQNKSGSRLKANSFGNSFRSTIWPYLLYELISTIGDRFSGK